MLDWIKLGNRNYPEFWRNYLSKFDKKSNRIVVLTIDTSGNDAEKDFVNSIGAVAIHNNTIAVGDSYEAIIAHEKNLLTDIDDDNLLEVSIKEKVTEQTAIEDLIGYLQNATIIGHKIDDDMAFLNTSLTKMGCGKLKNEALDLEIMFRKWKDLSDNKNFSINDLRTEFKIEKSDREDTIEDAFDLGLIFLKLKSRLGL